MQFGCRVYKTSRNRSVWYPHFKTQDCFGTSCLAMTPSSSLRAKRSNLRGGPRRWFLLAQRLHRTAYQNPRLLRHFVPRNDPFLVIASEAKQSQGRTETADSFRPNGFIVWPIKTRDCFGTSCLAMTKGESLAMTPFSSLRAKRSNLRGRTETPDSFRPNGFIVWPIETQDCFGTSCLAMTKRGKPRNDERGKASQ